MHFRTYVPLYSSDAYRHNGCRSELPKVESGRRRTSACSRRRGGAPRLIRRETPRTEGCSSSEGASTMRHVCSQCHRVLEQLEMFSGNTQVVGSMPTYYDGV